MSAVGKNMFDLRVSNRVAVLKLLYSCGGMSRKEIASRLNLTPAAISHISKDMISEGVLIETKKVEGSNRMGRHEIILEICLEKFKVLCAYVPTREVRISCIDLAGNIDFSKDISFDNNLTGEEMINGICDEMLLYLNSMKEDQRKYVIGIGVGIKGICDSERGLSINSFGLWEGNLHVKDIVEGKMRLTTMVDNNIRCVASAETLFSKEDDLNNMLFVKYGPLVGGAFVFHGELFKGYEYKAMELGHFVVDPMGAVCRCGKRGCLETVIGFDVIANTLCLHYSRTRLPILYACTGGDKANLTMETIMEAFDKGEYVVREIFDSALESFALMIVDAVGLIDPQWIILYGYPFENENFMEMLKNKIKKINRGKIASKIVRSDRNLQLDDLGCASIVIKSFLNNGGIRMPIEENKY